MSRPTKADAVWAVVVGLCVAGIRLGVSMAVGA